MAKIINLRQARKALQRRKDKAQADANAAAFGESKAERDLRKAEQSHADSALDGRRLTSTDRKDDDA